VRPARLTTQALIKHIGWQLTAAAAAAATNKAAIVYTECIGHDVPPPGHPSLENHNRRRLTPYLTLTQSGDVRDGGFWWGQCPGWKGGKCTPLSMSILTLHFIICIIIITSTVGVSPAPV